MHTDKDGGTVENDDGTETQDGVTEENMEWLLDMDDSDSGDGLFKVEDDFEDIGLSAFESEMASRPLTRGNEKGDDLANYVAEEIVISSDTAANDIYSVQELAPEESVAEDDGQSMAIDFTRSKAPAADTSSLDEGADVLGLASDDEMGEKPMAMKRVKATSGDVAKRTASKKAAAKKAAAKKTAAKKTAAKKTTKKAVTKAKSTAAVETEESVSIGVVANDAQSLAAAVGADVSMGGAGAGESSPKLKDLDDAPTTGKIADPEKQDVANEAAAPVDAMASLDDEAFDDFLLNAESGSADDVDLEDLTVGDFDDVLSLDTDSDFDLDLHEDFVKLGDLPREAASEISALIPTVLQQIHQNADQRLVALEMSGAGLKVDVMLAAEIDAVQNAAAEGYAPIADVMAELPASLATLSDQERGTVFVRLVGGEGNNWNLLFDEKFNVEGAESVADTQVEGFGEDIFGDDISAEFGDELKEGDAGFFFDIDDAFSTLSQADEAQNGEICGVDLGEFGGESEAPAALVDEVDAQADGSAQPQCAVPAGSVDNFDLSWCVPDGIKFSYASEGGGEIFAEFLDAFIEEGSAEVEKLEDLVSEWEKNVANEDCFAEVGRTLHTVKGIAKGVGLQRYGTLIHNYETLLEALPRPEQGQEQTYFRIVNAWLDAVVRGIEHVTSERQDIASELPGVGRGAAPDADEARASQPKRSDAAVEKDRKLDQQLADEGAKVLASQQSVRITSEKLDHLLNLASQTQQLSVRATQTANRSKRATTELQGRLSSVRTHIGKIADRALLSVNARAGSANAMDSLEMDQYSELQEAASILREGVEDLADLIDLVGRQNTQVETFLKHQSTVVSSISSSIQGARVVPVSRLMPGLRRIVRTVSTDLGKVVSFNVLHEVGALDRDHYARLQVVLEHMVRNAMDHGIESPDKRLASGKPEAGRITIDVRKSGGDYVIKLADDGRGIDPNTIRESAYEKGLDVDVDALTDNEALRLILHKGFSTAETVSEISGRGVGMDIVLAELQHIGGDIQIKSKVGEGTTFEVRVPSNLSVNGALMVTAADSSYAIPLNGLIAVDQIPADEYFKAVKNGKSLSLYDMDCEPTYLATLCQGVGLPERSFWEAFVPVIIAGSEGRYMAIAIDSVQEALEMVVRSLGSQFSSVPGLAGAATTADGKAIVALDLNLLVEDVRVDGTASVSESREEHSNLLALVVDDSRTQRMVATSQLDTVGVETVTAENGLVAIDLLNATHRLPDIVLLDVEMPVKDGIETLREIRKSQRYGHLPVIMVTSRTGAKHRALAKEAGCNAYMGKPFNFPALVEQINVLTGHNLQLS